MRNQKVRDDRHAAVLLETLEVAKRNLVLSRMSLEYLDRLRGDALIRIEGICEVIDRIEEVLSLPDSGDC